MASGDGAFEAVIFDVDGTLVDHDHAQRQGLGRRLAELGLLLDEPGWRRWRELEELFFAQYLAGETDFLGQRRERVRAFTDERLTDEQADDWFAAYLTHFEESWRLFDDVIETLDRLSGQRVAAFSNVTGEYTRRKLGRVGLLGRFEVAWGVDDVGAAKPAPETFHALCDHLQVERGRVLHVGDRYGADALGACEAGLVGVWLDRPGAEPAGREPRGTVDPRVTVVTSLPEVVRLVCRSGR